MYEKTTSSANRVTEPEQHESPPAGDLAAPQIHWPGQLPPGRVKRLVSVALGRVLSWLKPGRAQHIRRGELIGEASFADRRIMAAWTAQCLRSGRAEDLAPLHRWLWREDAAATHHQDTTDRFWRFWEQGHNDIVRAIQSAAQTRPGELHTVCEIGCGKALAAERLLQDLTDVKRYVGLDLSAVQTTLNQQEKPESTCAFHEVDAMQWIPTYGTPGTIYLTIGGVFEYFTRADLSGLFQTLANVQSPCMVALIETLPADFDMETERESRPFPPEHAYAHNYRVLLEDAGFTIQWQESQHIDGRWILMVATA